MGHASQGVQRVADVLVTTPHGYKPGASGVTLVCRPTPIVRFNHRSEQGSTNNFLSRLARADVWDARAFTQGSLPWNLQARLSCQCAKELPMYSFAPLAKRKGLPAGSAPFIPIARSKGPSGASMVIISGHNETMVLVKLLNNVSFRVYVLLKNQVLSLIKS